jgi:L-threonylcarbamoyladenylate synthase
MKTKIQKVNFHSIKDSELRDAVKLIQEGEIVAFPTETVYGLGASALNAEAVKKIFEAKGRPADNPLIVHVSSLDMLKKIIKKLDSKIEPLIKEFWPGALTILFEKNELIPDIVTAGLPTVAIRWPSNKIAEKLIQLSNLPIAAPSANSSGKPSPTNAQHVWDDLNGKIPLIIDGGSTDIGVESTVIDVNHNPPLILRPGGITLEQLKPFLPTIRMFQKELDGGLEQKPPTPGLKYRHYAPNAELIVVEGNSKFITNESSKLLDECIKKKQLVGLIHTHPEIHYSEQILNCKECIIQNLGSPFNIEKIAKDLYAILRSLDKIGVKRIVFEGIETTQRGLAVMNRLYKAASRIIKQD